MHSTKQKRYRYYDASDENCFQLILNRMLLRFNFSWFWFNLEQNHTFHEKLLWTSTDSETFAWHKCVLSTMNLSRTTNNFHRMWISYINYWPWTSTYRFWFRKTWTDILFRHTHHKHTARMLVTHIIFHQRRILLRYAIPICDWIENILHN